MSGSRLKLRVLLQRWVNGATRREISFRMRTAASSPFRPLRGGILLVLFLLLSSSARHWIQPAHWQAYDNGQAPPKTVTLEDGSTAILDSDSHVRTGFDAGRRRIELLRGQALFKVTHDARRPFEVTAARTTVRAVGTEFSVQLRDPDARGKEQVEVLVSEGRVRVVAGTAQMQEVSAGERAVTNGDHLSLSEHPTPGVEYSMSWTRGLLLFNGETLAEAAIRFNQYGGAQFEIADPSIAKQRIAGNARIGEPTQFVNMLQMYRVETAEAGQTGQGQRRILLRKTKKPAP
jgi:ferric-dicitrate binding protein FerR (iron transport regulator)